MVVVKFFGSILFHDVNELSKSVKWEMVDGIDSDVYHYERKRKKEKRNDEMAKSMAAINKKV